MYKYKREVIVLNYIKEAERIIKSYNALKESIENLNNRKKYLAYRNKPKELSAIDYSKPGIQKHDYSESTINQICEMLQINEEIEKTEAEIDIIENILKQIRKEDQLLEKFLRIKYIEHPKDNIKMIAKDLGYSEESNHTLYEIKAKALGAFALRYFGSNAMKYT